MNLPLRYKITIFNFIIILLAALFLTINFYNIYKKNVVNEIGNFQVKNASFLHNNIDLIEDNVGSLSTNLLLNQNFQDLLHLSATQVQQSAQNGNSMNASINLALNTLVSNDYISYIAVYTDNGYSFYYSKSNRPNALSNIRRSSAFKRMQSLRGTPLWTTFSEDSGYFAGDSSGPKLTMLRSIVDLNSYTPKGFMVICIDWSTLWSFVPQAGDSAYILTDAAGSALSVDSEYPSLENIGENSPLFKHIVGVPDKTIVTIGSEQYLYADSKVFASDFHVFSLMPMKLVMREANSTAPLLLLFLLVCLVFSLGASIFTSSLVSKPLRSLVKAIKSVRQGNFVSKVHLVYQDEIGLLGTEYNLMTDSLNRMFNKVLQLEIRNREAEIKAMEAQINPHFLYNTLDSIYLKTLNTDADASEMIYSLSRILRLTLNRGGELDTVENEKELVESYLMLQKIRFKDRLIYSIEIEPGILKRKLPKLLLQPFVENAIVHGLEVNERPLTVQIEGRQEASCLRFIISDNGLGIDPAVLDRILNGKGSLEPDGAAHSSRGFAIRNVGERLCLYYGRDDLLKIESEPGSGTIVSIALPLEAPEELTKTVRI